VTSNRVRELHDALKRRCLYHFIDYPAPEREMEIILSRVPKVKKVLARKISEIMATLRGYEFYKRPGVAETIDWAESISLLNKEDIDEETMDMTAGCLFKFREDVQKYKEVKGEILNPPEDPDEGTAKS